MLDDIERKHENLGIDEILGFIDEYTQRHSARFVLVLNSDQLAKRDIWDTLREKVIDQELKLLTTPDEACSIALGLFPSIYASVISRACITCGLTNIRIIGKVIRAANRILNNRAIEDALLVRVIPSIVLFSAIHYKGIEGGPDFQFALGVGSPCDWGNRVTNNNNERNEDEALRTKWRLLIHELGIHGCDEFEVLVVEYLESGLFDARKITSIIDRYVAEKQSIEAREKCSQFLLAAFWDHRLDDTQLLALASELPTIAGLLDPYAASELNTALAEIPGGTSIGQAIIDKWITAFKEKKHDRFSDDNPFNRPLHQSIKAEFLSLSKQAQARTTVLDACMHVIENSSWGTMQEVVMKNATASDFESAIRNMDIDKLRRFMRRMIEMRLQRQTFDQHFGTATDRFVEACRSIVTDNSSSRLAGLINRLFAGTALASELTPFQAQANLKPAIAIPPPVVSNS